MADVKIKLDRDLVDEAEKHAKGMGYGSVEEFIAHLIERELSRSGEADSDDEIKAKLRGLGYIS